MNPRLGKRTVVFALTVISFALAVPAGAQTEKYGKLPGVWDAQTEDGAFKFVFEFSVDNGQLAGKYTGASGTVPMKDLVFKAGRLSFSVDLNGMIIDFSASVIEDQMTGTLSLQFGEAAFAGAKRKGT